MEEVISLLPTKFDNIDIGQVLAATDVAYFEAAANNVNCHGGVLSIIGGYPALPLACVLHSLSGIDDISKWIPEVEKSFAGWSAHWVRFYIQQVNDRQREQILLHGYRESVEIGFATRLGAEIRSDIVLQQCCSEQDWKDFIHLGAISGIGPDGHDMDGESYAQVSRLKVKAGYMTPYLAILQGDVVGCVNLSLNAGFARLKNLLVHPEYRGRRVGTAITAALMNLARSRDARYFGTYAIAGEPSVSLYTRLGMVEVTRQLEWSKRLEQA